MNGSFTTVGKHSSPKEWTCRFKKHLNKTWSQIWAEDPQYVNFIMCQSWVDDKLKGYIVKQPFYAV